MSMPRFDTSSRWSAAAAPAPSEPTPDNVIPRDLWLGESLGGAVVVALLCLHWALQKLESFARKQPHTYEVLQAAYRETALLGVVSLCLFIAEAIGTTPSTVVHELEILHIVVWVTAALYFLWVILLVSTSYRITRNWRALEAPVLSGGGFEAFQQLKSRVGSLQVSLGLAMDELADQPSLRTAGSWAGALVRHPVFTIRYVRALHRLRFLELRERFIARHGLPPHFDFAQYLTQCKQHVFVRLVDLPVLLWATVLYMLALDLYLRTVWSWYRNTVGETALVVALAGLCIAVGVAVRVKMQQVAWAIFHSEFARLAVDASVVRRADSWQALRRDASFAFHADEAQEARGGAPTAPAAVAAPVAPSLAPVASSPTRPAAQPALAPTAGRTYPVAAPPPPQAGRRPMSSPAAGASPAVTIPVAPAAALLQTVAIDESALAEGEDVEDVDHRAAGAAPALLLNVSELVRDEAEAETAGATGAQSSGSAAGGDAQSAASTGSDSNVSARSTRTRSATPPRQAGAAASAPPSAAASSSTPASGSLIAPIPELVADGEATLAGGAVVLTSAVATPRPRSFAVSRSQVHPAPTERSGSERATQSESAAQSAAPTQTSAQAAPVPSSSTQAQAQAADAVASATSSRQAREAAAATYRRRRREHLAAQRRLFWFRSPIFLLRLLQASLFLCALSVALFVIFFADIIDDTASTIWAFTTVSLAIVLAIATTAGVVPQYVLAIHVSDLVDVRLLAESLLWVEKQRAARDAASAKAKAKARAEASRARRASAATNVTWQRRTRDGGAASATGAARPQDSAGELRRRHGTDAATATSQPEPIGRAGSFDDAASVIERGESMQGAEGGGTIGRGVSFAAGGADTIGRADSFAYAGAGGLGGGDTIGRGDSLSLTYGAGDTIGRLGGDSFTDGGGNGTIGRGDSFAAGGAAIARGESFTRDVLRSQRMLLPVGAAAQFDGYGAAQRPATASGVDDTRRDRAPASPTGPRAATAAAAAAPAPAVSALPASGERRSWAARVWSAVRPRRARHHHHEPGAARPAIGTTTAPHAAAAIAGRDAVLTQQSLGGDMDVERAQAVREDAEEKAAEAEAEAEVASAGRAGPVAADSVGGSGVAVPPTPDGAHTAHAARPSFMHRARAHALLITTSHRTQAAVTAAILADFFLLAMLAAPWLRMPGRAIVFAIDAALVAFIALELCVRIWAVGPRNYLLHPRGWERLWNLLDVAFVAAAVTATVLGIVWGDVRLSASTGSPEDSPGTVQNLGAPIFLAPLLALRLLRASFIMYVVRGPSTAPAKDGGAAGRGRGGAAPSIGRNGSAVAGAGASAGDGVYGGGPGPPTGGHGGAVVARDAASEQAEQKAAPAPAGPPPPEPPRRAHAPVSSYDRAALAYAMTALAQRERGMSGQAATATAAAAVGDHDDTGTVTGAGTLGAHASGYGLSYRAPLASPFVYGDGGMNTRSLSMSATPAPTHSLSMSARRPTAGSAAGAGVGSAPVAGLEMQSWLQHVQQSHGALGAIAQAGTDAAAAAAAATAAAGAASVESASAASIGIGTAAPSFGVGGIPSTAAAPVSEPAQAPPPSAGVVRSAPAAGVAPSGSSSAVRLGLRRGALPAAWVSSRVLLAPDGSSSSVGGVGGGSSAGPGPLQPTLPSVPEAHPAAMGSPDEHEHAAGEPQLGGGTVPPPASLAAGPPLELVPDAGAFAQSPRALGASSATRPAAGAASGNDSAPPAHAAALRRASIASSLSSLSLDGASMGTDEALEEEALAAFGLPLQVAPRAGAARAVVQAQSQADSRGGMRSRADTSAGADSRARSASAAAALAPPPVHSSWRVLQEHEDAASPTFGSAQRMLFQRPSRAAGSVATGAAGLHGSDEYLASEAEAAHAALRSLRHRDVGYHDDDHDAVSPPHPADVLLALPPTPTGETVSPAPSSIAGAADGGGWLSPVASPEPAAHVPVGPETAAGMRDVDMGGHGHDHDALLRSAIQHSLSSRLRRVQAQQAAVSAGIHHQGQGEDDEQSMADSGSQGGLSPPLVSELQAVAGVTAGPAYESAARGAAQEQLAGRGASFRSAVSAGTARSLDPQTTASRQALELHLRSLRHDAASAAAASAAQGGLEEFLPP